ncbi:laccase [[Haemophilus] ducreyi]|uniref:Purine nucleoside phosphorylase n=2 Tax=Haemophilus ducreyi TaxID=730 RepID=Q7VM09_HAEDU|nr:peptidoglycan editing factor PgeF [[Haemophilus] ducreyi]AAP96059.1 hypothetical protein HD_1216 [[Haemophilus] ducreyi 35000HP]AKO31043.1 laccase [[Haemophilus] ducreyi]AKO32487.1 laccase [[Haemophilus] ducreyi]AKO33938.1 laccase [[Haemophilus] ducreyi]AKO35385.1 laccase [[Haemophilus] ducreyi]
MKKLIARWQALPHIHAFTTVRQGGVSQAPFDSFNLAAHVGDNIENVMRNRQLLVERFNLPHLPLFLTQTHSTRVIRLPYWGDNFEADAVYTDQPNQVCLVMTADCLPVFFCSQDGLEIAVAHAGWRGLCDGILENTLAEFSCAAAEIMVWLGPAIGPSAFQVGKDVVEQFCMFDANAESAFSPDPSTSGKFLGNLYQIAIQRLTYLGIKHISGGQHCTYLEKQHFFSYRREGKTGRMASLIWRDK